MLAKRHLRSQMYSGAAWLLVAVVFLSAASIMGSLKFRKLTKSFRGRAMELPLAVDLNESVSMLQQEISMKRELENTSMRSFQLSTIHPDLTEEKFRLTIDRVATALHDYRFQLENAESDPYRIGGIDREIMILNECEELLQTINGLINSPDMNLASTRTLTEVQQSADQLQSLTIKLPKFLKVRMDEFSQGARAEYYSWLCMSILVTIGALVLLYVLYQQFRSRVIQPLEILVDGSRIVARGNYDHRVVLNSDDEVSELAGALNAMTGNFQAIQSDLNNQVKQRTQEIVRSEKMASVGFLAAGVAHEINNPLSSIAWSAESLESRLYEILNPNTPESIESQQQQVEEMKKYLQRIQEEAFRCKEITSALLDFSRMGDSQKKSANLNEIIETVVDMVRPLSKYRNRTIEFSGDSSLNAHVNPQELKQVMLNLITNALDSVEEGGKVEIELCRKDNFVQISVTDDGCGMTEEVMQHLFEPFFTRRRDGQGTGLGLSITYQIIQEHGGDIQPQSDGTGKGSTFIVTLPEKQEDEKLSHKEVRYAA